MTRPADESLEAFVKFRKCTATVNTQRDIKLSKEDLNYEWEKFWEFLKIKPKKKKNQIIQVS